MPHYTDGQIADAVQKSQSVFGVMRCLGIRLTGGSHSNISRRIKRAGINKSHFTGQGHNLGKASPKRLTANQILVKRESGLRRQHAHLLRRGLTESGVLYECAGCGAGPEWQGCEITLQVDHINEDWLDDRQQNLQFLCPNCHAVKS